MSFLYPRTVALSRTTSQAGQGKLGYGGKTQAGETEIRAGVPASIQLRREGQRNSTGLPADGARPSWDIFTPRSAFQPGDVVDRDILTDDLGRRFQVLGDYIDSLGGKLRAERLEA